MQYFRFVLENIPPVSERVGERKSYGESAIFYSASNCKPPPHPWRPAHPRRTAAPGAAVRLIRAGLKSAGLLQYGAEMPYSFQVLTIPETNTAYF